MNKYFLQGYREKKASNWADVAQSGARIGGATGGALGGMFGGPTALGAGIGLSHAMRKKDREYADEVEGASKGALAANLIPGMAGLGSLGGGVLGALGGAGLGALAVDPSATGFDAEKLEHIWPVLLGGGVGALGGGLGGLGLGAYGGYKLSDFIMDKVKADAIRSREEEKGLA